MIGWAAFAVLVLGVLALDLFVFRRRTHAVSVREGLLWSALWVGLALAFAGAVTVRRGPTAGIEFLTAYLIEESLSIDNLFVFLLLFAHFKVPAEYRHKVLFWGILGAMVMRLGFVVAGVSLLRAFEWVVYLFGAVLVYSGIKMVRPRGAAVDPEHSAVLRLFRRLFPVTPSYEGDRFLVRRAGRITATPLLVVLLMVETTDLVFAVDSIPAVLGISRDPFIVYTSNVFAILGLRSMFFVVARLLDVFRFLHHGLALILVFVGLKMILSHWVHVPTAVALGFVGGVLATAVAASLAWPTKPAGARGDRAH